MVFVWLTTTIFAIADINPPFEWRIDLLTCRTERFGTMDHVGIGFGLNIVTIMFPRTKPGHSPKAKPRRVRLRSSLEPYHGPKIMLFLKLILTSDKVNFDQ